MEAAEIFAQRLKELREEKGLSQCRLAGDLGVSRGAVSYYENAERTPDIKVLAIVKDYFHVDFDYLLGYSSIRNINELSNTIISYGGTKTMGMTNTKPVYPENAYCAIFGLKEYPDMPPDPEGTLEYVMKFLSPREAEMFMLRYRDEITNTEIGERHSLSRGRVIQIIANAERKLRHPSRSKILRMGQETYLHMVAAENEAEIMQYRKRIADLEALIQKQESEIGMYQDKLLNLHRQSSGIYDVLGTNIHELGLSVRSYNCLARAGMETVKDILDFGDLSRVRNLGRIGIQEVQRKIKAYEISGNREEPI